MIIKFSQKGKFNIFIVNREQDLKLLLSDVKITMRRLKIISNLKIHMVFYFFPWNNFLN